MLTKHSQDGRPLISIGIEPPSGAFGNGWIEVYWALELRKKRWRIAQSHYQYLEAHQDIVEDWLLWQK